MTITSRRMARLRQMLEAEDELELEGWTRRELLELIRELEDEVFRLEVAAGETSPIEGYCWIPWPETMRMIDRKASSPEPV